MSDAPWTIGRLLTWTTDYLKKQGRQSPRLDAELLLARALGCERIELYTRYAEEPDERTRAKFRDLVKQRAAGKPVAQLLGYKEFFSLKFRVTIDTLTPRPETETLVVFALDRAREVVAHNGAVRVGDIGTGAGPIAITLASQLPEATFVATDVSDAALAIARENAATHKVAERIQFRAGDLLDPLEEDESFHVICANLPYVGEREYPEASVDVRDYEPQVALVGGPEGNEIIERLIAAAPERLKPGGWLVCEASPQLMSPLSDAFAKAGAYEDVQILRDTAGMERVIAGRRKHFAG